MFGHKNFFCSPNFIAHKKIWTPNSFVSKISVGPNGSFYLTIFLNTAFFRPIIPNVSIVYDDEKQDKAHKYI